MDKEALAARGIRVRELVWLATERKAYEATGFNLRYYIRCSLEGQWVWQAGYGTKWFEVASLEAARAAAQADYETRILAALEVQDDK